MVTVALALTHVYRPGCCGAVTRENSMPHVKVYVTLKPTLLDAQGRVVHNALESLGYGDVSQVRIGKYIEMEMAENTGDIDSKVKEMCDRLLANPVIENYRFEVIT
jgi:phosphoribosylformylglycinamidine synthase